MDEKRKFDDDPRPLCKYSPKCYQKNADHKKKFKHHPVKTYPIFDFSANKNKRKLEEDEHLYHKKGDIDKIIMHQLKVCSKVFEMANSANSTQEESDDSFTNETNTDDVTAPLKDEEQSNDEKRVFNYYPVVSDIAQFIKDKFLVKMPQDFYKFWEFYSSDEKFKNAMSVINLSLVGPFDVLRGSLPIIENKPDYLIHWRHFYDPPEFQTIFMSTEDEFHIGYYRDSPADFPVFTASNKGSDCKIQPMAENIFGTLLYHIQNVKINNVFHKSEIESFAKELKKFAVENKFTLDTNSASMKERLKSVNAKTFHGAGIVVPYNKDTQIGYRPLIEKDDAFKKILKVLVEAKSEEERDKARSTLQPILTMASVASDEYDFGTGLELGIDLFCYGRTILHGYSKNFLTIAYDLLDREAFGEIIKVHLSNRRKGSKLSVEEIN